MKPNKPPFVVSQGIRLLLDTERPQRFLRAEYFRAGRGVGPALASADLGSWLPIDRRDVVRGQVAGGDGQPSDLSRLVVTTDAGVGKTIALRWLCAQLNRPGSDIAAFLLYFHQLPPRPEQLLPEVLVPCVQHAPGNESSRTSSQTVLQVLEALRSQGKLVLLLDALDQAPPDGVAVDVLHGLLNDPEWRGCRFVVSGRPHALQRHWQRLFDTELGIAWRFVQLDEFNEREQRQFLGQTRDARERFDLIPQEAREILSTPRVLEYLRDLPDRELQQIRTAGDVYWHSINHLLREGMKNSDEARHIGLASQEPTPKTVQRRSLLRALELLGGIAFGMSSTLLPRAGGDPDELVPNFDGVPPGRFRQFADRVQGLLERRPGQPSRQLLDRDIDSLAALNDFLSHGIFDTDVTGLDRIFWRNRTLQEFFTAYWLAQFCTDDDAALLWDWVCLPERPLTEEYYWVWRFLCEMHDDARNPEGWSRAIEPIYRPGDGTAEGMKRSCEMIYRGWQPLTKLAEFGETAARRVRDAFLGEFESVILAGGQGEDRQRTARQFCDRFLEVPAGQFRMGSPTEKQGMPEDLRRRWTEFLNQEGDPAMRAEQLVSSWSYSPGKQGQEWKKNDIALWTRVFRDRDIEAIVHRNYPANETPEDPIQTVDGFLLNQWPTINAWYRLFDPSHGLSASWYDETYSRISPEPETPAIFVTWYDAWAFCLWARWQGESCRLPREYEWEYAAKAGTAWDQNYWWGDDFDADKCNAERHVGRTTPPSREHANPWKFEDILGNVWEWCEDEYRRAYSRDKTPESSARVLRGGSWSNYAHRVRSAYRDNGQPTFTVSVVGFRVARALKILFSSSLSSPRSP